MVYGTDVEFPPYLVTMKLEKSPEYGWRLDELTSVQFGAGLPIKSLNKPGKCAIIN